MLRQLLVALLLASITVVVHALGTVRVVLPLAGIRPRMKPNQLPPSPVLTLCRLVFALLVLHVLEMVIWATAFVLCGMFPDFEPALYFSLKSFTTVGYGDVLPRPQWRLLGPIEAAVGVLMMGLSTGVIVAAVQRILVTRALWSRAEGPHSDSVSS